MSGQQLEVNQVENQQNEDQDADGNEKPFTVEQPPHELNALMQTLRNALTSSASGQEYTDKNKSGPPSDSQKTS